ncbi:MAG: hypothetical protein RsTaC01_0691 [Candidatus Paraimprobicoccus trichonymphae]|uniref:Uncharacterized protein n=1 Tax=Candidatus Paraimprobicoccus trichonymphae TaxID=3033793 RepID=A0AA48HWN3_9FIRM|nr:MAG: hypothetical protein RsTaC01_0691 [Candidatus Paraimprobicoccus trichonymphae]
MRNALKKDLSELIATSVIEKAKEIFILSDSYTIEWDFFLKVHYFFVDLNAYAKQDTVNLRMRLSKIFNRCRKYMKLFRKKGLNKDYSTEIVKYVACAAFKARRKIDL